MRSSGVFSASALVFATGAAAVGVWTTPHDKYSSSVGVLGCKINTNRVAYWPGSVDCNNICVKLSYGDRSVHLLRIDQSGGAYDISYDAYNYLQTGKSATADPISGGATAMDYEEVDASECADLIYTDGSKLPLSAANSMNFLTSCLAQPGSWVAQNYVLYNICDAICTLGFDEKCVLDLATSNQPSCAHTLGLTSTLATAPVYDIEYESGKIVMAGSGLAAPADAKIPAEEGGSASTQASQTTASAALFIELSSSSSPAAQTSAPAAQTSAPAVQTSTTAAQTSTPTAQTSAAAVQSTTISSTIATSSSRSETSSSSLSQPPTTTAVPTVLSYNGTATYTAIPTAGNPSSRSSTTLSVVTVSSGQSTTSTSSPSSVATVRPTSAGRSGASVSVLTLLSSIIICSVAGAF